MMADNQRRNDEAVRRIRAESARRIGGQRRRHAFSSWCALAMLAGGISLAALDARETRLRERAQSEEVARQAEADKSRLDEKLSAIKRAAQEHRSCRMVPLERAAEERERARRWIREEMQKTNRGKRKIIAFPIGKARPSDVLDEELRDFR